MTKLEKKISVVAIIQTILMGMIDAFTFIHFAGSFATAQTGNIVTFGVAVAQGKYQDALIHVPVFMGFLFGAIVAQLLKNYFSNYDKRRQFQIYLLISAIFATITFLGYPFGYMIFLFMLGMFSSYELTMFSEMGGHQVNNGIMTGNIKNLGNNLANYLFKGNKDAGKKAFWYSTGLLAFVLGILIGGILIQPLVQYVLLVVAVVNILLTVIFLRKRKIINKKYV